MARQQHRKIDLSSVVSRDPEVHSGALVFAGTRVPVETFVDYLKAGHSVDEFVADFPTVERWQVEAYLDLSPEALDYLRTHVRSRNRRVENRERGQRRGRRCSAARSTRRRSSAIGSMWSSTCRRRTTSLFSQTPPFSRTMSMAADCMPRRSPPAA
jgi:uncharacterized protein (DUF433 family)